MKFRLFVAAVLGFAGFSSTAHASIQWETDYALASAKSRAIGKPLLIDFYTDWCGWCKKMDQDTYTNPTVQALSNRFVMLKLDAERGGKSAAAQFKVSGYPTVVYVAPSGQTLANIPGYLEAPDMIQTLRQVLNKSGGAAPAPARATAAPQPRVARRTVQIRTNTGLPSMPSMPSGNYAPRKLSAADLVARQRAESQDQGGVLLLDEYGAIALDAPRKSKTIRTVPKATKVTPKAKRKRVRN